MVLFMVTTDVIFLVMISTENGKILIQTYTLKSTRIRSTFSNIVKILLIGSICNKVMEMD
jgi:hypothetical protein